MSQRNKGKINKANQKKKKNPKFKENPQIGLEKSRGSVTVNLQTIWDTIHVLSPLQPFLKTSIKYGDQKVHQSFSWQI